MSSAPATGGVGSHAVSRRVLVSNLVAGGVLAGWSALALSWPLAAIAAAYVAVASAFLATIYARTSMSWSREILAWALPWALAVALWSLVVASVEAGTPGMLSLWVGTIVGTGCYLVWQVLALALRRGIATVERSRAIAEQRL